MLEHDISTADAMRHLRSAEHDPHAFDRRRFLQLVGMGMGAGLVAGGTGSLLDHLVLPGHDPSVWAAGPVGPTDGILVVIGMYGGNDGLNTVVPFNDGNYYTMHGSLAIPGNQTLALDGHVGLNPELPEFKRLWDAGNLAIVDGVGYSNPDLSHFNSMAYWMAGKPNAVPTSGWLGRWLDGYLSGSRDLYAAAEVGYSVPLHLIGQSSRGTAVPPNRPGYGADTSARSERQYAAIREMQATPNGPWFDSVAQAFVDQLDLARTLSPVLPDESALSDIDIVAGMEVAARLINANLGLRVVTAGWGEFDSHAGQPTMHTDRMRELNAAVKRFYEVLGPAWKSRVTVMTFSEFGRTPWDNDGAGTDHGTSAPHFVFGDNVKGGRYGRRPTMAGLGRWDRMASHVDFRSYYASIIDGWLGGGSSTVLGGNFENLGLFKRGPGRLAGGTIAPGPYQVTPPSRFKPLSPRRIGDTRDGTGGLPRRKLRPRESVRLKVAGVGGVPASGCTAVVVNVTSVEPTAAMYFTVYPGSTARPLSANLNGGPGRPVPNLVVMGVGDDGRIEVFNSHGETHCVVDVFGYFTAGAGDRFVATSPRRLFDTRSGTGIRRGKILDRTKVDVQVAGKAGVPASGATAVVMNLAVTQPSASGYLRASPKGTAASTSNVNFGVGDTIPNLVICKIGSGGKITLDGRSDTHAVGDVFGYFAAGGDLLQAMGPQRVLDTRSGLGAAPGPVGPKRSVELAMAGRNGIPNGATAVVLNVAATNVAAASYVTVWPAGSKQPGTANLNLVAGRTIANLVICRLGEGGALMLGNSLANCDLIADVLGYFVD
jgi:uncharacterized protein (DUF1501 family)